MYQSLDPASEQRRAGIAASLASYYSELSAPKAQEKFSLRRMLNAMAARDFRQGASHEAEVVQAAALAQGRNHFDPQRAIVPWGALRDLTASIPSAGGNLVGAMTHNPMDVLRPFSVVARMGVSTIDGLTQDLILPNLSAPVTGNWLAGEGSSITSTDPATGQIVSKPKTGGALVKASFQFMRQAQTADEFIRQQLLAAMGAMLDAAVLQGSGASGQPTGLALAAGVNEQSGAVTHANMLDAISTLATAKADDEKIKFLTTPAVRRLLQARETIGTSGVMLWRDDKLADRPGYVTTDCPAATIFAGDWSKVLIALWGSGLEIAVDPFTSFQSGAIQARVMLDADVIFTKPAALLRHTAAT